MMTTITISRQLGSQGDAVAQAVANRLGYRVVYREVINRAASEAHTPEMALAVIDVLGLLDVRPSVQEKQAYQQAIRHVIETLAGQGNVIILGRAGCVLLQDRRDVLHVRVVAPMSQRIERLVQTQGITPEAAGAQIEASDRTRRDYVNHYHHVDWQDPQLYDLVLNMGKLTVDSAAELICLAHTRSFNQESDLDGNPFPTTRVCPPD